VDFYVITCTDKPDRLSTRLEHRPAHLAYISGKGKMVKLAGPFLTSAAGDPCGSPLIVEAEDLAAAEAFAAGDPYVAADVFDSVQIRPWRLTVGGFA
jgi:uncharacterized protein YciI